VDWERGRAEHLKLSAAAAPQYDELYEYSNYATGSYMNYEVETIEKWTSEAPDRELAIDLGCGTGRDSFVLAKHFDQVWAFDFSPEMVRNAEVNKVRRNAGNVFFRRRDVDLGLLDVPASGASFVNSAFGMGSFVEHVEAFFRDIKRILRPQGVAVFSFYNSIALVNRIKLQWRPALAATPVPEKDILRVDFGGKVYEIAARAYEPADIRRKLEGNFQLLSLTTFPTLSALFPQELFSDESARRLCGSVDHNLAENLDIAAGPYIVAVVRRTGHARKPGQTMGYRRVLELLTRHDVPADLHYHEPVRNMEEVRAILAARADVRHDELVKSILVAVTDDPTRDERHPQLHLFAIPSDRRLDFGKVARLLDKPRSHVKPAFRPPEVRMWSLFNLR
jgi:SAM-dependent methyltransferase